MERGENHAQSVVQCGTRSKELSNEPPLMGLGETQGTDDIFMVSAKRRFGSHL